MLDTDPAAVITFPCAFKYSVGYHGDESQRYFFTPFSYSLRLASSLVLAEVGFFLVRVSLPVTAGTGKFRFGVFSVAKAIVLTAFGAMCFFRAFFTAITLAAIR